MDSAPVTMHRSGLIALAIAQTTKPVPSSE